MFSTKKQDITINIGSTEIVNPKVITEVFNAHFCEAPGELLNKHKLGNIKTSDNPYFHLKSCTKSLFLTPITEFEVVEVAKGLKNKLASGVDDIPDLVIKKCIDYLKKPLTHIFNTSLEAGFSLNY
jgi:hypothetical protein